MDKFIGLVPEGKYCLIPLFKDGVTSAELCHYFLSGSSKCFLYGKLEHTDKIKMESGLSVIAHKKCPVCIKAIEEYKNVDKL